MENMTVSTQLVSQAANASPVDASAAVASSGVATNSTPGGLFGTLLARRIALVLTQDGQAQGELPIDLTRKGTAKDALPEVVPPQDTGLLIGMMPYPAFTELASISASVPASASELPVPALTSELSGPALTSELSGPVLASKLPVPALASELPALALASELPGPILLPAQKAVAANLKSTENPRPAPRGALPANITMATSGKDLPVGDAKALDFAAIENLKTRSESPSAPSIPMQTTQPHFSEGLVEKKAEPSLQDFTAPQPGLMSSPQIQGGMMPADRISGVVPPELIVPQRVGSENWGSGLGDKVVWMVGNQTRSAEIHLNPPTLGPLEVRVSISDGQANLSFMTQHASVREAIEAATPRLREMLGDTGISTGSVSVNVGSFAQQQAPSRQPEQSHGASWRSDLADMAPANEVVTTFVQPLHGRGLVDFFA